MDNFLFVYRSMIVGGSQLLIVKLANQVVQEGNKAFVLCEFAYDEIITSFNKDVCIIQMHDKYGDDREMKNIMKNMIGPDCNVLTLEFGEYNRLCYISNYRVIFYAVLYTGFSFVVNSPNIIKRIIRTFFLRKPIIELSKKGNFIVMDEATLENSTIALNYDFSPYIDIVRIPVDFNENDYKPEIALGKFKQEKREMLAIARASFPFKGYLLGLVDEFAKGNIPDKWHLTIITYGDDVEQLYSKYEQQSKNIKDRIKILGKMKYEDLEKYFNQAHVFIGMGTTLLDASKHGVISIPVEPYNNNVKCSGFFHDSPEFLGGDINDEDTVEFKTLIERLDSFSSQELSEIISEVSQIVPQYYATPKTWEKIKRKFELTQNPHILRIFLFFLLRRFLRRFYKRILKIIKHKS